MLPQMRRRAFTVTRSRTRFQSSRHGSEQPIGLHGDAGDQPVVLQQRVQRIVRTRRSRALRHLLHVGRRTECVEQRLQPIVDVTSDDRPGRRLGAQKEHVELCGQVQVVVHEGRVELPASLDEHGDLRGPCGLQEIVPIAQRLVLPQLHQLRVQCFADRLLRSRIALAAGQWPVVGERESHSRTLRSNSSTTGQNSVRHRHLVASQKWPVTTAKANAAR